VRLTNICLEGWDVTLDADGNEYGGITWGPSYATKHACSNGPLIEPLVSIWAAYQAAGQESQATYYLEWADKIYTWEINHLLTSSGLFGDLIGTSREIIDGKLVTSSQSSSIDEHFYTYNTGVMLSAAARLYGATGESKYLTSGKRWAKAAYRYFATKDKGTGIDEYPLTSQTTWFNAILLQGFLDMAKYDDASLTYVASMQSSIDYAYENYLKKDGFLPRSYVKGWDKGNEYDSSKNVMDQASAAMSYAMMAAFYQSLSK
jgi:predicted alpha-1,6-mannanase (GH76 family)